MAAPYEPGVSGDICWTGMAGFSCVGTWVGPDRVFSNESRRLGTECGNHTFSLEQIIDGGDLLVGIGTYSGIYGKTGKPMRVRVTHVRRVADVNVVGFAQFTDTLLVAMAMQV